MRILKRILWVLLIILIIAQFFGPEKNQGTTDSISTFIQETNPPDNVKIILKETCFDCHSDVTRYPWYFNITPVNYWMNGHIRACKRATLMFLTGKGILRSERTINLKS